MAEGKIGHPSASGSDIAETLPMTEDFARDGADPAEIKLNRFGDTIAESERFSGEGREAVKQARDAERKAIEQNAEIDAMWHHTVQTDKDAGSLANADIEKLGLQGAAEALEAKLKSGEELAKNTVTKGVVIALQAQRNGDVQMNRDGFSLLAMEFTGDKAMAWKLKYITAFNEMEAELKRIYAERNQWEIERAKGVMIRHILTDTIKLKIADSPNKRFAYPSYTKLIYKTLFGKSFKELQQEYGVKPKESLRDYLTSEQLKEVESMEMLVSSLINVGMGYDEIKDFITERCTKQLSA